MGLWVQIKGPKESMVKPVSPLASLATSLGPTSPSLDSLEKLVYHVLSEDHQLKSKTFWIEDFERGLGKGRTLRGRTLRGEERKLRQR